MKNKILIGALLLVLGIGIGACANPLNEWVQAYKWADVTIKYNGSVQTMKDANGKVVYPLNYEGTTYVPVRAVSNIFGVPVDWDNDTKTVLLGENNEWTYLSEENVYHNQKKNWYQNNLDFTHKGINYKTGYKQTTTAEPWSYVTAGFEFEPKYKEFSCKIICESKDGIPVNFTIMSGQSMDSNSDILLRKEVIASNFEEDVSFDISEYDYISIGVNYSNKYDTEYTVYILDAKVK